MNDTLIHFASSYLPFGGVGNSGMGSYHGKWGFDNCSHLKPIIDRKPQVLGLRYPPFTERNQKYLKFLLEKFTFTQYQALKFVLFSVILISAYFFRNSLFSILGFGKKINKINNN